MSLIFPYLMASEFLKLPEVTFLMNQPGQPDTQYTCAINGVVEPNSFSVNHNLPCTITANLIARIISSILLCSSDIPQQIRMRIIIGSLKFVKNIISNPNYRNTTFSRVKVTLIVETYEDVEVSMEDEDDNHDDDDNYDEAVEASIEEYQHEALLVPANEMSIERLERVKIEEEKMD